MESLEAGVNQYYVRGKRCKAFKKNQRGMQKLLKASISLFLPELASAVGPRSSTCNQLFLNSAGIPQAHSFLQKQDASLRSPFIQAGHGCQMLSQVPRQECVHHWLGCVRTECLLWSECFCGDFLWRIVVQPSTLVKVNATHFRRVPVCFGSWWKGLWLLNSSEYWLSKDYRAGAQNWEL